MMNICFASLRSRVIKFAFVTVAASALLPAAQAGTYSIVGLEWNPSNSPGIGTYGGYIRFGIHSNPLDIEYGCSASISAPWFTGNPYGPPTPHVNAYLNPQMVGLFRWKVRWVGAAGEPSPSGVLANTQYKGSASTNATAMSYGYYNASATANLSDPYFPLMSGAATTGPGPGQSDPDSVSGVTNVTVGAGAFGFVAGSVNTWEGWVNSSVNTQAPLEAHGSVMGTGITSFATASVSLDVTIRLTHVGGQRVQPDL